MCMQCAANSAVYVGGAVGALQVLKARARRRPSTPVSDADGPAGDESTPAARG